MELFKNRNFVLLWLSQVISAIGDVLYTVGVMVTIFEQTGSALQTIGVMVATTLPQFLLGPFVGPLVDRYSRKWMMVITDVVRAGLVGVLLFVAQEQTIDVWLVYLVVTGLSTATAFYNPAKMAIIPAIVPASQLVTANSVIIGTLQATMAVGFLLGGLLVLQIDFASFVLIDLLTFVVAGVLVMGMKKEPRPDTLTTNKTENPPQTSLWQSFREGVTYLRNHDLASSLIIMELLEHIPHGIWTSAMMLVFMQRSLGGSSADWGYLNSSYFMGQIVGAGITAVVASRLAKRPGRVIIITAFLFSVLTITFALSPNITYALALAFIFGPPSAMRDITQDTLLQATTDKAVMGRIYAIRNMMLNLNFMIAGVVFAWLADFIEVRWIYVIGGLMYLGTAFFALSRRAIRQSAIN